MNVPARDLVDLLPRIRSARWSALTEVGWPMVPGFTLTSASKDGLRVLVSAAVEADTRRWIHVSFSRADRVPSYGDICEVKDAFIGRARKAVQVFPAKHEWVNDHAFCLHLFSCLDADPLPDFRRTDDETGRKSL